MEPERKIEKLLRACAKKRRADAGDAFKLHPATRRMLQGEVARQTPRPEEEPESLSLWELFKERWAVLLGFALIIFFGATLFLPVLGKAKMKSKSAESISSLKQIGVAAQMAAVDNSGKLPGTLDILTNQLGSAGALTDSVSGKPFVYVAGGAKLDELHGTNVLAYSPADRDRTVLFADGSVRRVRRDEFSTLTNQAAAALAMTENVGDRKPAALPATATAPSAQTDVPVASAVPVAPPALVSGFVAAQEFARVAAPSLDAARSGATQNAVAFKSEPAATVALGMNNSQRYRQIVSKASPVLNTFEVRQNGSQLAVVDQDGSIYNGSVHPVEVATGEESPKATSAANKPGSSDLLKKDFGSAANKQVAVQNYFFRVSGANRSLRQDVEFAGNLTSLPNQNQAAKSPQQFEGSNGKAKLAVEDGSQSLFSNSRITGTVTIGQTNQVEINALPVTP
jgi:hypothetical protein